MVKKPLWTALFLVLICMPLTAQEGVQVSLRFFNKDIYYPESPVPVLVSLKNKGAGTAWFSFPNNPLFGLTFQVLSMEKGGQAVSNSEKFKENRFNNQPVFFRDVTLRPGEEFSFQVDLKDWFDDFDPGVYQVTAQYYPSLIPGFQGKGGSPSESLMTGVRAQGMEGGVNAEAPMEDRYRMDQGLKSNNLLLSVRPSMPQSSIPAYQRKMDEQKGELLEREKLAPDEVVSYVLQARQMDQEEKFFLYLNLEELYKRDPNYKRSYLQASAQEREAMLRDYHALLWQQEDFLAKRPAPGGFEILSTTYTRNEAAVKARLRFDQGDYFEVKEYTYSLRRMGNSWEIYDYRVTNRPAESKKSEQR